tara:strand:+ start:1604 stop:2044 length:441 start_codon:yes stop_codon:yes gene_type:complete
MITITPLEFQFLKDMVFSDHSTDGHGICMWVTAGYSTLRPKVWRGVVSSLMQKGIIGYSEADPGYRWQWDYENDTWDDAAMDFNDRRLLQPAWVQIREEYQKDRYNDETIKDWEIDNDDLDDLNDNFRKACIKWTGYELINLEVKA